MAGITGPINFPYSAIDLTESIEVIPNLYGRINEMDLMPADGVSTTMVEIRFEDGVLTLLPTRERGAEPTEGKRGDERSIFLKIPHIPHKDVIRPDDLQDKQGIGRNRQQRPTVELATQRKLQAIRNKHAITLEFMRMGALKGVIEDGEGTLLYDLYEVFGVQKKTVHFALNNDDTVVQTKCHEVRRHLEQNLLGEVMNGVGALVSPEFFDALISHPNVREAYERWETGRALRDDMRRNFVFGGIRFEEYEAAASDMSGQVRRFIAADEGHAFPTGTMNTFRTHFGPANHIAMVNTLGTEVFVSPEVLKHGAGIELQSESNPLPLCRRPALLVELQKI